MDLFISAAWTAASKVPKKTAFGVDLVWGDNAFATLAEAKAAGKPSPVYHDFDKNVTLDNSGLKLGDVRSQEIKPTLDENPAKLTFSAKSKIAPSGSITVSNSDVYGMTVTGFKDVTLKNGGLKAIEVRGGNNTVVHTDTEKIATGSYTKKNVATLNGKADGTLLLSGTSVSNAYGAWAKATGMYAFNYDIGTAVAEFTPCDPGNPANSTWGASLDANVLKVAPGYATVTLAGGGVSAGVLQGGKVDYSRTTEATYRSNDNALLALNKTLTYNTTAAGTLTVVNGNKVNQAYRYANVAFKNDPTGTEFTLLQGGNSAETRKTTYKYTPSAKGDGIKMTGERSISRTAAGTVSIDGLKIKGGSFNRDISGYAKITIVSAAYLGDVDATNYKENVKSSYEVVNSGTPNEKVTSSYSSSQQYTAGGTLANGSDFGATFSSIQGFSNVNLAGAHVSFGMAATAAGGAPASTGSTCSETWSNSILTQSKATYKTSTAAAGTAVIRDWSDIRGGVNGFQTVKFSNSTTVSGPVGAGKAEYEETQSYGRTDKNGVATHKYDERYKGSYNALGTLTMNGGKLVNAALMSFATVTLDGVAGVVTEANALGSSGDTRTASTYIGVISSAEESSTAQVVSGVGTLTIANGGALVVSSIYGYNKIAVTSAKVNADITSGRAWKFTASEKTSSDGKADIQKYSLASATSSTVAGSVVLTGVTMAGDISGYKTLTLDDTAVAGNIGGIDTVESDSVSNEYTDDWVTTLKFSQSYSSSATPNIALTLKNGATVGGAADGVKTLTLGASAEVGDVYMASESVRSNYASTYDNKKYIESTACYSSSVSAGAGTVTLAADAVAGNITGAAKVTATSATLGDLSYNSLCEEVKSSSYDSAGSATTWYNYNMTSNTAATATLTSTYAGALVGYGNAKVTACIINGAYAGSRKYSCYEMSSTQVYSSSGNGAYAPVGAFTGQGGTVNGGVDGYQTVSLDGTYVDGNIGASSLKTTENLKITYTSDGAQRIGQSYTREYTDSPTATLTLKNNAGTYYNVSGFKTVNLATNAWINSAVCMSSYGEKEISNITSNAKTNLFEWNCQSSFSYGAPGTFTATGNSYIDKMIYGAAKVTLTDADAYSDVACDNTFESSSIVAKGEQLTAEAAGSPVGLDSKYATEWNERDIYGYFASGTFTLTRGMAQKVSGFTTVKLTSASIESAVADNSKRTLSHTFKNGTDLMTEVYSSGVAGTLTATDTTFAIGGVAISGYATVNLTRCVGYGQIYGGIEESFGSGTGNAAYFSAAKGLAEADFTSTTVYKNGGKLTAVDTTTGDICHFSTVDLKNCFAGDIYAQDTDKSTVTFSGDNYLGSLYYCTTVTVKNGETEVNKCIGTDGSDSVTVNAGTTLTVGGDWNFAGGDDKATINGIVRLLGTLGNSDKLALTGSGIIAVTNANFNKITYDWAFGYLGDLTGNGIFMFVNAGTTEGAVRAIRTQKEELADNTAKGARKLEADDMDGWLSGEESLASGKFADTVDWIKFKYEAGADWYADLEVNGRNGDLTVELYKGGTMIQDVAWNNYSKKFDIDETALTAGTEYLLKLAIREDAANKTALAYGFHKA